MSWPDFERAILGAVHPDLRACNLTTRELVFVHRSCPFWGKSGEQKTNSHVDKLPTLDCGYEVAFLKEHKWEMHVLVASPTEGRRWTNTNSQNGQGKVDKLLALRHNCM